MEVSAVCGITAPNNSSNKRPRVFALEVDAHPLRYNQGAAMFLDDHCRASSVQEATRMQVVSSVGPKLRACRLVVPVLEEDLHRIGYDKGFGAAADHVRQVRRLEVKDLFSLRLVTMEVAVVITKIDLGQAGCMTRQVAAVMLV